MAQRTETTKVSKTTLTRETPSPAIEFKAEGLAFSKGKYDLRVVERLITDYRRLIDLTLPFAVGQKTLTDKLRDQVNYQVEFSEGSLLAAIEFIYENRDLLPLLISADPTGQHIATYIAKLINSVIELRRWYEDQLARGKRPKLQLASNNDINIPMNLNNVNTDGGSVLIQPIIIIAAEITRPTIDNIIRAIDGEKLKSLSVKAPRSKTTTLSAKDRKITGTLKEELPKTIDVVGRLNVVNFDCHRGQIVTENGKFPVTWHHKIRREIQRVADTDGVLFTVRPVVDKKRFHDEPVGLYVLRCGEQQHRLAE